MPSSLHQHSPDHAVADNSTASVKLGLLLTGIILIAATMRSPITATGPIVDLIRADTGISHTMAGLLTSLPLLAFAAISPLLRSWQKIRFGGRTADRYHYCNVWYCTAFLPSVPALLLAQPSWDVELH